MARFGQLDTQYFDASGDPLSGGKIYFFESGTTTPKTTYADINNSIPNTHPVILDAAGRQPNIFFDGVAKATLTDSSDVTIVTRDPVGETATNFGDEWVSTRIYSANDVVIASDGQYYRSLQSANQNNNPVSTSGYWTLLYSVEWNSGITYGVSAVVTYDNQQYQSLQASNVNHQPDLSPTWWVPLNFAWDATATYADNQNVVGTDGVLYTSQQASNLNHDPTDAGNRPTWWVGTSTDAAASAAAAATSEANAATSESNAATSATNSANSATASASSASASAASAASASSAQTAAETAQTAAEAAQTAAETAQTGAETAETNAATSASNSATSAANSASSASAASSSAAAASASQSAAATSAANALTSENNASASESAAATSEANASSSASSASASSASASTSATNSANSATASANSATASAASATSAEAAWDQFDDTYLGQKASDPTVDNDGNPLATGALYFNTTANSMKVYNGTSWQDAGSAVNGTANRYSYTATSGQTSFSATYDVGFVDVYMNGVKLDGADFTATNGTSIVLNSGAATGDIINIIGYGAFQVANALTVSNNLSDVASASAAISNLGITATATELNYSSGVTSAIQTQLDNLATVPAVGTQTGSYTLTTADTGKYVQVGSGGSITVPDATFSEGDVVNIFNNTTGDITVTCSITTAYISGADLDVASVTLATRGLCTIFFISGTVCVIAGAVS